MSTGPTASRSRTRQTFEPSAFSFSSQPQSAPTPFEFNIDALLGKSKSDEHDDQRTWAPSFDLTNDDLGFSSMNDFTTDILSSPSYSKYGAGMDLDSDLDMGLGLGMGMDVGMGSLGLGTPFSLSPPLPTPSTASRKVEVSVRRQSSASPSSSGANADPSEPAQTSETDPTSESYSFDFHVQVPTQSSKSSSFLETPDSKESTTTQKSSITVHVRRPSANPPSDDASFAASPYLASHHLRERASTPSDTTSASVIQDGDSYGFDLQDYEHNTFSPSASTLLSYPSPSMSFSLPASNTLFGAGTGRQIMVEIMKGPAGGDLNLGMGMDLGLGDLGIDELAGGGKWEVVVKDTA